MSIPVPADISLDADTSRSGSVGRTLVDKVTWGLQPPTPALSLMVSSAPLCCPQATWTWGPDGHGAILLVNCDRDDPKSGVMDNSDTAVRSYEGTATHPPPFFCFSLLSVTFLPNLSSLSP